MPYRRTGRSGLKLPAITLGLWQNFGDDRPLMNSRAMLRRAFDLGITHFDLANNYGPPYGSAEINFGRIFSEDFAAYRDEIVVSTKAGYDMWDGPYGEWGSRKYVLASLEQSLTRMRLDYVDIFYSHRLDSETPLEETMGALDTAVRQGKARYVGISSYGPRKTEEAAEILRELGTPLLIHQPSYSLLNRWIEEELIDVLGREGVGAIVFSPLAQGMLTDRYLDGVPDDSRVKRGNYFAEDLLTDENLARVRGLAEIAGRRGQTLAQMAIAWVLRDERVTSALLGASSVKQLEQNVAALDNLEFDPDELAEIDRFAVEGGINLWEPPEGARLIRRNDLTGVVDVRLLRLARDVDPECSPGLAAPSREHGAGLAVEAGCDLVLDDMRAGFHRGHAPDKPGGRAGLERTERPRVRVGGDRSAGAARTAAVAAHARWGIDDPDRTRETREVGGRAAARKDGAERLRRGRMLERRVDDRDRDVRDHLRPVVADHDHHARVLGEALRGRERGPGHVDREPPARFVRVLPALAAAPGQRQQCRGGDGPADAVSPPAHGERNIPSARAVNAGSRHGAHGSHLVIAVTFA